MAPHDHGTSAAQHAFQTPCNQFLPRRDHERQPGRKIGRHSRAATTAATPLSGRCLPRSNSFPHPFTGKRILPPKQHPAVPRRWPVKHSGGLLLEFRCRLEIDARARSCDTGFENQRLRVFHRAVARRPPHHRALIVFNLRMSCKLYRVELCSRRQVPPRTNRSMPGALGHCCAILLRPLRHRGPDRT